MTSWWQSQDEVQVWELSIHSSVPTTVCLPLSSGFGLALVALRGPLGLPSTVAPGGGQAISRNPGDSSSSDLVETLP